LLGEIESAGQQERVVLADMEAGLGTLSRMAGDHVDYVLVMAEPTPKALEVARRAVVLARDRNVGQVLVVANRIRTREDLEMVRQALPGEEILVVPEDRAIEDADREAMAPIDAAPDSPGVQAIIAVVRRLLLRAAG
jgi:CO dehydrogenase maturation factor